MSEGIKSFVFAVIMCVICSTLLTLGATGLRSFQEKNILLDKRRNILLSAGLLSEGKDTTGPEEIARIYSESITALRVDGDGNIKSEPDHGSSDLPIYLCRRDDAVFAYVVPFTSRGLWGKIDGYLALDKDGATVKGFTVYRHQETPGLGGEIEKRWFQKNFSGKKIVDRDGNFVSVAIAKGKVADSVPESLQGNYVDGISGATLTGKFLSEGLKDVLVEYEPVSVLFRHNRMKGLPDEGKP
jgi:Na+-transporting NADH:ubiquinone oxidoreductase subunit C